MDLPQVAKKSSHILSLHILLDQSKEITMRNSNSKTGDSLPDADVVESKFAQGYHQYYQDPENPTPRGHAPCGYSLMPVPDYIPDTDDEYERPSLMPHCLPDTDDEYEMPKELPNSLQLQLAYAPPPRSSMNMQCVEALPNLTPYPVEASVKLVYDAAAQTGPPPPSSLGAIGHPRHCAGPCKFFWKLKGCKDGDQCDRCHACPWSTSNSKPFNKPMRRVALQKQQRWREENARQIPRGLAAR